MASRSLHLLPIFASLCAAALCLLPGAAEAVEFRLDGMYRVRANLFDTLSMERETDRSEGVRTTLDQRMWLDAHLRLNANVHVFVELDLFDGAKFGDNPETLQAFGQVQENGERFEEPTALSNSVLPGTDYRESLFLRRAWAELYTPYVDFKVGRMGSHWGMGLVANDGDCDTCDYGDTVDRIMVSTSLLDPVRINFAIDTRAEGFINREDDTHSFLLSGGYLSEVHRVGAYLRWTRQPINSINVIHADLWGATKLGPLSLELEAALLWAEASNTEIGIEELKVLAGGGALRAGLDIHPFDVDFEVGLASGDSNNSDNEWHTFRFDRDHDVALLMFEQPLPIYAVGDAADADNQNEDFAGMITGEGVSNAFYVRPAVHFDILDNLKAGLSLTASTPLVKEAFDGAPEGYGAEIDVDATWTLYSHFELGGRAGILFPGPVYGEGRAVVFGGELRALVHF